MFPVKYGKYELLERIARGGMAEIYKARITGEAGFQKLIALKKLHAHLSENHEMVNMLKDEANIVSNMMHPNICQVYDLGKVKDTYYIAMEYIHGKDLSTIIRKERKRRRKIPLDIGLFIVRQVLTGLDYAHRMVDPTTGNQLNIVHRDISPQNIIVSYSGGIKVIDFGIAKATQGLHHTQDGVIKGKFRYMAPEQAMGKNLDHRVDIFATGVVLYEMLMGESHSRGASDAQLIIKAQTANFEPIDKLIKDLPNGLGLAVMKSMSKNIDNRFPSARTFRNALDRIVKREGLEVAPDVVSSYLSSLFPNPFSKGSRVDEIEQLSGSDFIEIDSEIPDATGYFKGQKHPDPPPPMDLGSSNSSMPQKPFGGFSQPDPDFQNSIEDIPPPDPVDLSKIEAKPLGLTKATSEKGRERRRRERLKKKKHKEEQARINEEQRIIKREEEARFPQQKRNWGIKLFLDRMGKALVNTAINFSLLLIVIASAGGIYKFTVSSDKKEKSLAKTAIKSKECKRGKIEVTIKSKPSGADIYLEGTLLEYKTPVHNLQFKMCYNKPLNLRLQKDALFVEKKLYYPVNKNRIILDLELQQDKSLSNSDKTPKPKKNYRPEKSTTPIKKPSPDTPSPSKPKKITTPPPMIKTSKSGIAGGIGKLEVSCPGKCVVFINGRNKGKSSVFKLRARNSAYTVRVRFADNSLSSKKSAYIYPKQITSINFHK